MAIRVVINSITGASPYDVYICQPDNTGCFYIATINSTPYQFDIPTPYDNLDAYMLKIVDNFNCIITGIEDVQ